MKPMDAQKFTELFTRIVVRILIGDGIFLLVLYILSGAKSSPAVHFSLDVTL
jgi:hypothetical protein